MILKRAKFFVGECGSKVNHFVKNALLDVLIVLARDEHFFYFGPFFQINTKGGTIALFFEKFPLVTLWKCLLFFVGLDKTISNVLAYDRPQYI